MTRPYSSLMLVISKGTVPHWRRAQICSPNGTEDLVSYLVQTARAEWNLGLGSIAGLTLNF